MILEMTTSSETSLAQLTLAPEMAVIWKDRLLASMRFLEVRGRYLAIFKVSLENNIDQSKIIETMSGLHSYRRNRLAGSEHIAFPMDFVIDDDLPRLDQTEAQIQRNDDNMRDVLEQMDKLENDGGKLTLMVPAAVVKLEDEDEGLGAFEEWVQEIIWKLTDQTARYQAVKEQLEVAYEEEIEKLQEMEKRQADEYNAMFESMMGGLDICETERAMYKMY